MAIRILRTILLALVLVAPVFAAAQLYPYYSRSHDFGGSPDYGVRVARLSDGSVAVAGRTYASGKWSVWIKTFDRFGQPLGPSHTIGDSSYSYYLKDMVVDAGDNIYYAYEQYVGFSDGSQNVVLSRFNFSGAPGWTQTFNGPDNQDDRVWDLAFDGLGNIGLAGDSERSGGSPYDAIFLSYSATNGTPVRNKRFQNGGQTSRFFKVEALNGEHYLAGEAGGSLLIAKVDQSDVLTSNTISSAGGTAYGDMSAEGGLYISGGLSPAIGTAQDFTVWHLDTTTLGVLWSRNLNGLPDQAGIANVLKPDGQGNILAAGNWFPGSGKDLALAKFDVNGNRLFNLNFPVVDTNDEARKILIAPNGQIYLTGEKIVNVNVRNILTAVIDPDGTFRNLDTSVANSYLNDSMVDAFGSVTNVGWGYANASAFENLIMTKLSKGIKEFALPDNTVNGGTPVAAEVTLWEPAPDNMSINLSENSDAISIGSLPQINAGDFMGTGLINTNPVSTDAVAAVSALFGTQTVTGNVFVKAPVLTSLAIDPNIVYSGGISNGTVQLSSPTPAGGMPVALSSNTSVLVPPASINIQGGQSIGSFAMNVGQVTAQAIRTVTATLNGETRTVYVTIRPGLKSLSISPANITGGSSSTGTILLGGVAPTGGTSVIVEDNSSAITTPASVTVPAGSTSTTFVIGTNQLGADANRTVTARLFGVTRTVGITITAGPRLSTFTVNPTTVEGGSSTTGTATLTGPAPSGGRVVALSDTSSAINSPASLNVNVGSSSGNAVIGTVAVGTMSTRAITATLGGVTRSANLTLIPVAKLLSLGVSPSSVTGGQTATGTVTLTSVAPPGGKVVALSDNSSSLSVPATVTVGAGASTATFTVSTSAVNSSATRQVSATLAGITKTANVTVNPE